MLDRAASAASAAAQGGEPPEQVLCCRRCRQLRRRRPRPRRSAASPLRSSGRGSGRGSAGRCSGRGGSWRLGGASRGEERTDVLLAPAAAPSVGDARWCRVCGRATGRRTWCPPGAAAWGRAAHTPGGFARACGSPPVQRERNATGTRARATAPAAHTPQKPKRNRRTTRAGPPAAARSARRRAAPPPRPPPAAPARAHRIEGVGVWRGGPAAAWAQAAGVIRTEQRLRPASLLLPGARPCSADARCAAPMRRAPAPAAAPAIATAPPLAAERQAGGGTKVTGSHKRSQRTSIRLILRSRPPASAPGAAMCAARCACAQATRSGMRCWRPVEARRHWLKRAWCVRSAGFMGRPRAARALGARAWQWLCSAGQQAGAVTRTGASQHVAPPIPIGWASFIDWASVWGSSAVTWVAFSGRGGATCMPGMGVRSRGRAPRWCAIPRRRSTTAGRARRGTQVVAQRDVHATGATARRAPAAAGWQHERAPAAGRPPSNVAGGVSGSGTNANSCSRRARDVAPRAGGGAVSPQLSGCAAGGRGPGSGAGGVMWPGGAGGGVVRLEAAHVGAQPDYPASCRPVLQC